MGNAKPEKTAIELPRNDDDQATAWSGSASDYASEFLDPFRDSIENPLLHFLAEIDDESARSMTVADLGCGTGPLLPHLVGRFGGVIALDFADGMLEACRKRLGPRRSAKVRFLNRAMHELDDLAGSLDVAAAVNSLVMPDPRAVDATLRGIFEALKPGGQFLGVVPSIDGIHHHSMMLWDAYLDQGYSLEESERLVATHMEHALYDFAFGKFEFGAIRQKFWQPDELAFRLRKAGFDSIELVKLNYPWDESLAGYKILKNHPKTWDWTFKAIRRV